MQGPSARPAGSVWQGWGSYDVYESADCVPWKWEPGPTQLRRQAVAARSADLLATAILIDTETTGVGDDSEVIEIAILDSNGSTLLNTLVRPTQPIPAEATSLHRITDAMVANAPTWPEIALQYEAIIAGRTVVAYNAQFDQRVISQTYQRYGMDAPELTTACAMLLYASWNGEWVEGQLGWQWRWIKLGEAARECGVLVEGAHRALADTQMTLGVLRYLQKRSNGRKPGRPNGRGK